MEPHLTRRDRQAALKLMKPYLRRDEWDAAVSVALEEIAARVEKSLAQEGRSGSSSPLVEGLLGGSSRSAEGVEWWNRWNMNGGGGGGSGGGEGGGGGGGGEGIGDVFGNMAWPQDSGGLLLVPLLWGVMEGISAVKRRRVDGFQEKLLRINTRR